MSENSFPGFEDEEPATPATPASKPPVSPAKAPAKAPTGTIKAGGAQPPPLQGASGPVAFEFEASAPSAPKTPAFVPPVARIDRSPPSAPAREPDVDPELKPGSRKDLWNCPHCGTGNRPGRDTCRNCGKSPDDEVVIPWTRKPLVWVGAGAGAFVALILIIMIAGHTDLSLRSADAATIDSAARVGGSGSSEKRSITGQDFTTTHQISVCGRVIGATQMATVAGGWTVALLLGKRGADPEAAKEAKVDFNGDRTDITGTSGRTLVLHLMPGGPITGTFKPTTGSMLSLVGDSGELEGLSNGAGEYSVVVTQLQQN